MAEKKVLAAIKEIEAQIEASHRGQQQRNEELLREYLRAREPLLQRRYELVTGQSEPTAEELKGFKPQGAAAAAAAAAAAGAPDAKGGGAAVGGGGKAGSAIGKGAVARGVPFFWLNALCNQEKLAEVITPRDRCALEYLEDVRYVVGPMGLALEFHFAPNPYFHNKVLRKGTFIRRAAAKAPTQDEHGGREDAGGGGGAGLGDLIRNLESWRDEYTVIDWKPGRSLLVRAEQQKQQQPAAAVATGSGKKGDKQQQQKAAAAGKAAGGGGAASGGGKKKGKGKKGAAAAAAPPPAVPSRSKRHHGKHGGPAPDLPDPEEEEQEEEQEEEAVEGEQEEGEEEEPAAGGTATTTATTRRRPCPSFFRFFLPLTGGKMHRRREVDPTVEDGDEEEEDEEEDDAEAELEEDEAAAEEGGGAAAAAAATARLRQRRAQDAELMEAIVKLVVPRATTLYLAGHTAGGAGAAGAAKARNRGGGDDAEEVEEEEEGGFQLVSGSPAGDVASLALGAQRALHALVAQQRQLDDLAAAMRRGEWEAWVRHVEEVARLAARRRTLLVGPAAASSKLSVPAFWLRALRAAPFGSLLVQHRDERALSYLADVRLVWDTSRMPSAEDPQRRLSLELEFLPNPYFTNSVLVKKFTFHAPGGSLNRMWVIAVQSDPIDWQPGRDLTVAVRAPAREAKEGAAAAGGRAARPRKVASFFAFFDDSTGALCRAFGIPGGQSAAALQEANQAQEEFLGELINVLVNRAAWFAAESNLDVDDLGDEREEEDEEEEGEDEEDEEGEDGDEDGGEGAAARRAARRAAARAAKRRGGGGAAAAGGAAADGGSGGVIGLFRRLFVGGGGGGSGGVVMGVFVVIMLLAQVLMFLDTLEFVRARLKL